MGVGWDGTYYIGQAILTRAYLKPIFQLHNWISLPGTTWTKISVLSQYKYHSELLRGHMKAHRNHNTPVHI